MEEKREMTVAEAGRMGGQKTALRYGPEFYEKIGKKGGEAVRKLMERGRARLKESDAPAS